MKLRIRGNSIRLRLLKSEVNSLAETSRFSESITLGATPTEKLTYAIQLTDSAESVTAGFCENEICIIIPTKIAREWADSDQVGIETTAAFADHELQILVEKDFVCLTRTDDPDSKDAYPNPEAEC